jgi:hypothetical protein
MPDNKKPDSPYEVAFLKKLNDLLHQNGFTALEKKEFAAIKTELEKKGQSTTSDIKKILDRYDPDAVIDQAYLAGDILFAKHLEVRSADKNAILSLAEDSGLGEVPSRGYFMRGRISTGGERG